MTQEVPMSLDDDIVDEADALPAKDNDGVPYCRKHHCRMKQMSGGKKGARTSYFACQVAKCEEKAQRIKTTREGVVPPQPLECPRCKDRHGPSYCERDPKASTAAMVILRCPGCGWKSTGMVVPQLAAAHFARRSSAEHIENIGDR